MLRRLLLLAVLIGLVLAARRFLVGQNDSGSVAGSLDHWPPVPRKDAATG
jgi:hypothetical protein